MTPSEAITRKLDTLNPDAESGTVVEYEGQKYKLRYFPLSKSRSRKAVTEWGHRWTPVNGSDN